MKTMITLAATLATLLAAAPVAARSPEAPSDKPERQCFWSSNVNGFASSDPKIVNIRVGVKDVYQFEMMGPCHDVDWAQAIAIRTRGGSSFICSGLDADLIVPSSIGPHHCPVTKIRKLTAAEIAALPKGSRP